MDQEPEDVERYEAFGRALRAALAGPPKMTQTRLAEDLGVDQTLVSVWGRGKKLSAMTRGRVMRIEQTLGPQRCSPGSLATILFGPPLAELPRAATPEALVAELRRLIQWWDDTHGNETPSAAGGRRASRRPLPGALRNPRTGNPGKAG